MVEILIAFLLFIPLALFSFYVPGKVSLHLLNPKLTRGQNEILSWFVGICLFLFTSYAFAWLGISHVFLLILLGVMLLFYFKWFKKLGPHGLFKNVDRVSFFIIFFGSLSFFLTMFFSGLQVKEGVQFIWVNAVDGIRHVSYIKNMELFFPPQQPGLTGETFRGFHYFYDFLLSRFGLFYGFKVEDLYFRLFPLLIAPLYGAGFYLFSSFMTKDKAKIAWILTFAYFSQSSAFLLYLFNPSLQLDQISLVQPIGLIVNPFMVLALGILLCGLALIPQIEKSWKYALLVGLLLGVLSQIKVYTGLVGIFCVVAYPLYRLLITKKFIAWKGYLLAICLTAFFTAVTFLPNNYQAGGLVLRPLLYYREAMQRPLFESLHWELQRLVFVEHNNWPRIAILYAQAFGVFWLLNLGSRVIMFARTGQVIKKTFWKDNYNILVLLSILFPLFLGSFFIQTVSVFDTVQFFWVVVALLSIPSGIAMGHLWMNHGTWVKLILISFFVAASAIGFVQFMAKYLAGNPLIIPNRDIAVFQAVAKAVPEDKYVVYVPSGEDLDPRQAFSHKGTLRVSAMTGRSVYFEPGGIPGKSADVYKERKANLYQLHRALLACEEEQIAQLLEKIGTKHIVTENTYSCLETNQLVVNRTASETIVFYLFK